LEAGLRGLKYVELMLRDVPEDNALVTSYMNTVISTNYEEIGFNTPPNELEEFIDTLKRVSVAERACFFK
jgi:hypothetical protein